MDKIIDKRNLIVLVLVVIAILGGIAYLESKKPKRLTNIEGGVVAVFDNQKIGDQAKAVIQSKADKYELAREIISPSGFLNTDGEEINIQGLIGKKVILVDFWTYTCINCQRTFPYLISWYDKYKDQGLEIVSIHTPEFEFEKDIKNVQKAIDRWGINYPVVLDNDYGTWQNYKNRYWPHKFLIDIDGYIVYDHIGEGGYDQTEKKIQELLNERMERLNEKGKVSSGIVEVDDTETVTSGGRRSPEAYFGSLRNKSFASGSAGKAGEQTLKEPSSPKADALYLSGTWDIQPEFAENKNSGAKIIYKFKAAKVFLVARADQNVTLTLLLDGQPVGEAGGRDVNNSQVIINDDRLYRLIELSGGYSEHTLEIIVETSGLQAFAFTFG